MSDADGTSGPGSGEGLDSSPTPETSETGTTESEARNRRTLWIVGGVVLAIIAIAVIWWFQGNVTVPNVVGAQQAAASASLEAVGLTVGRASSEVTLAVAPGTVMSQSPKPGASVREGTSVDLVVAAIPVVAVPDVVGKASSDAEADLAVEGLQVGEVTAVFSDDADVGIVLTQSPEADAEVPVASVVALEISAGPKQGAVPDVTGLSSTDANDVLDSAGFAVKETKQESADVDVGVVMSQSPSAGTVAEQGTTVKLTVSTGPPSAEEPAPPAEEVEEPPATEPPTPEAPTEPEAPPAEKPTPKPEPSLTEVPDLIGMRVLEAFLALRKADLQFSIEWGPTDEAILRVIEQDPSAGADVDHGTVVNVTIGLPSFLFEGVQVQPLPTEPPAETDRPEGAEMQPAEPPINSEPSESASDAAAP